MLSFAKSSPSHPAVHKNVHSPTAAIPVSAVLWEVLHGVEVQLQRKGMLPSNAPASFNPLWFLAETERNVFLWQQGCSLIDQEQFEFWIDIPKLLNKRRAQLKKGNSANPFTNPLWGESEYDPSLADRENEYLEQLEELVAQVAGHAHALSIVASQVQRELHGEDRPRVVLPVAR